MKNQSISQLYSELFLNSDLTTLAERCKLLTEILLDCTSLPQVQPVSRCLAAYLDVFHTELDKSMADFRIVEFSHEQSLPQPGVWLLEDTETQCNYCRALNHVLLISHYDRDMLPYLTGLLHDIAHAMAEGIATSAQEKSINIIHC
ncbi:hypothetical protein D3C78_1121450 [compost metagenome]